MTRTEVMAQAIKHFGRYHQIVKAVEEMSELQKELCKNHLEIGAMACVDDVSQEMADVEIMLEQLKMIFGNRELVEDWKELKLTRLESKLTRGGGKREES